MAAVALLFPTAWDRRQFGAGRDDVVLLGPDDADVPAAFDVLAFVEETAAAWAGGAGGRRLAGVTSSSDYPGAVAAALLARRLGLPGASPEAVLATGHK